MFLVIHLTIIKHKKSILNALNTTVGTLTSFVKKKKKKNEVGNISFNIWNNFGQIQLHIIIVAVVY